MALSLLPSSPAYSEGSQIIGAVNALIVQLNNNAVDVVTPSGTVNLIQVTGGVSGSPVLVSVGGPSSESNVDFGIYGKGTGDVFIGGATKPNAELIITPNASGINAITMTGGASGVAATIGLGGASANASATLGILANGLGTVAIGGLGTLLGGALLVPSATSVINNVRISAGTTGVGPVIAAVGSDTDVDLILNPKGSGLLRFNNAVNFTAIGAGAATLTNVAPAGLASSTVSKWLTVKDSSGGLFFLPAFH